ncbi:MAG: carboxypeptidase-like regulatory domain-containing protein [Pyrinomonadaceae bacterium]
MIVSAGECLSQQHTATISGTVTDELGGLVPEAAVRLVYAGGNEERRTQTNALGYYSFKNLAPGSYTVQATAAGFLPVDDDLDLKPGRNAEINLKLTVALEQQDVTVDERGLSTDADRNANSLILKDATLKRYPRTRKRSPVYYKRWPAPPADRTRRRFKSTAFPTIAFRQRKRFAKFAST